MSVNQLSQPYFIEAANLGQVAAGKVVEFLPRECRKWIPLPKGARAFHQYAEYEICGDSLEGLNIFDGDLLTCRKNFELSEVKPKKICIVRLLHTNEQIAKMVRLNDDGTVTLSGANPRFVAQTYFADEVEIMALVVEVRRQV